MTDAFAGARLVALVAIVAVLQVAAPAGAASASGLPALANPEGALLSPADSGGKAVVVNFWASWCAPCRKELPSLDRLAAKRTDLVVIAASVDADKQDGMRAFAGHYPHLRLAFASLAEVQRFGALGMPYSIILDRSGREAARVPHALDWDGRDGVVALGPAFSGRSAAAANRRR